MSTATVRNLAGVIDRLEAIEQTGDTSGIGDLAVMLRRDLFDLYARLSDQLRAAGQESETIRDIADQFDREATEFAPEMADRPNPITQPGDPNVTPQSERRDREAEAERRAQDAKKRSKK